MSPLEPLTPVEPLTPIEPEPSLQPDTTTEDAAPARPPRFPCFDGLRAIAALTVIVVHTSFIGGLTPRNPNGLGRYTSRLEIGVAVFFLISGFLLYRPFAVAHLSAAPKPRTGAFWVRRLLRIVPAFWLVLFVETRIWHDGYGLGTGGWTAEVWQYGFAWIYSPAHAKDGLAAGWTLCVELTFYLFLPLYAMLIGRRRAQRTLSGRMHAEFYGLAAMVAVSFAWRLIGLPYQNQHLHSPYFKLSPNWFPAFLDLFALGMFLAVVSAWMHHNRREYAWLSSRWLPWASWALAGVCFWAVSNIGITIVPLHTERPMDLLRQTLYGGFAFFLLVPAVFGPQDRGLIRRFLRCWPIASLGVISYGIYLWHEAWIYQILKVGHFRDFTLEFWAFTLAVLVMSCITASLSYFILEKPALRLKNSIAWWRRTRPADPSPESPPQAPPASRAPDSPRPSEPAAVSLRA
ncbi:MAG: acyltransferase family protein [Acidimicrobiales bacterium]